MKNCYLLIFITVLLLGCTVRKQYIAPKTLLKKYDIETVAFYNLENLFDTIDAPDLLDEISPIMEMKYGRGKAYCSKIKNMAKVISLIGKEKTGHPPALLGVAEVENQTVLEDLVADEKIADANYQFIHFDSPDKRGIDVSLLYSPEVFTPIYFKNYPLKLWNAEGYPIYTRDVLLVSGYLKNDLVHILVNHWPSRRGGEKRSAPLRMRAALLVRKIIDELALEYPNPKVLIMGDFNDNPDDKAMLKIIEKDTINNVNLRNPYLKIFKNGSDHTLVHWGSFHLFDQILLTENFFQKPSKKGFTVFKSRVFRKPFLTSQRGAYKQYPYRSFSGGQFTGGYSDHYPAYVYLVKEIQFIGQKKPSPIAKASL